MRGLLLLIGLFSCGGKESICVNQCGLVVTTLPDGWTCKDLIDTEAALMKEMAEVKDYRLRRCDLDRFELMAHKTPSWTHRGVDVMGLTFCSAGRIEIGNSAPHENALPHEMVHALQNCEPFMTPGSINNDEHEGWFERGIEAALDRVWADLEPVNASN